MTKQGTGQIEKLASGRYRVRLSIAGVRRDFGPYDTPEEAARWRDDLRNEIKSSGARPNTGLTLATYAQKWIDDRERESGLPDMPRRGALKHIKAAPFANKRLTAISRGEILVWLKELTKQDSKKTGKPLAAATRRLIASTLSCVFLGALDEEKIKISPAIRLRVKNPVGAEEPWNYLLPEEQELLLTSADVPLHARLMIQFAMHTGIRSGEQWALELGDVHLSPEHSYIVVRYGGPKHRPTKSRKVREVPLSGRAVDALQAWLKLVLTYAPKNPKGLVFPTETGAMRRRDHPLGRCRLNGKRIDLWRSIIQTVFGPDFRFRWHDLRHTCGSSLISGWWGTPSRLEEIRDFLGHSSVKQTERYSHLVPRALHTRALALRRSPREAHASQNAAKQEAPAIALAIFCCDGTNAKSGTYAETWASGGLRTAVLDTLRALDRSESRTEDQLNHLLAHIIRAAVEADPVASAALRATEVTGPFKADRFVEAASKYLSSTIPEPSRKERAS